MALLNPLTLHFQKLDLELKCPQCLNLLNKPMLLPCNHIVCHACIPSSFEHKSECPTCKNEFSIQDLRPAPYIENLVTIYRSLHSTFTSVASTRLSTANIDKVKEEPSAGPDGVVKNSSGVCLGKTIVGSHGSLTSLPSHGCKGTNERLETQEDMHRVPEPSPESSPTLVDSKDRNCNGSVDGSCGSVEKCRSKILDEYVLEKTCYVRDSKRQKMLDYSSPKAEVTGSGLSSDKICHSDNNASSSSKLEEHSCVAQPTSTSQRKSVCAFCHTSHQTDGTGPLLYYANGKEVDCEATSSNVIPVHSKCIEWTPRVYFKGDTIKNLESELGRSAKLKCSSCGQKGAALGCFEKSCRRTYHVPCAFAIPECRWDCEDFLMLCPTHKSGKFPREKSRPRKNAGEPKHPPPTEIIVSNSGFWATSPSGSKEWVFCGSALSSEEKFVMVKFATMCGATVPKLWRPNVTHVIAATDEKGACTRTLKVLMAILNGRWILNVGWIKACMEANCLVNEEPYEISLDNHGCLNGPKTGRLRVLNKEPKLFEDVNFYFTGGFMPAYKFDLFDLVRTAGGAIIESVEQLVTICQNVQERATCLVVYNADPPPGCSTAEGSSIVSRMKAEAHNLANQINSSVVGHKWILDTIAAGGH